VRRVQQGADGAAKGVRSQAVQVSSRSRGRSQADREHTDPGSAAGAQRTGAAAQGRRFLFLSLRGAAARN